LAGQGAHEETRGDHGSFTRHAFTADALVSQLKKAVTQLQSRPTGSASATARLEVTADRHTLVYELAAV